MREKFLSMFLAIALVLSTFAGMPCTAAGTDASAKDSESAVDSGSPVFDSGAGRILYYSFDFANAQSTIIPDDSGKGKSGELKGQASIASDMIYDRSVKALSLAGGEDGGYLKMPKGVFDDASDVTISCWVKVKSDGGYQRIWDFGNNTTSYMYLLTDGYNTGAQGYAAAITTGGWSQEQTAQMGSTLSKDKWIFTTVVLDSTNHTLSLYKDGALIDRNEDLTVSLKDLGTTANNYIGYGQFKDDPIGGEIADFSIYNYAMSSDQVSDMYQVPDQNRIDADKEALDLGDISQVTDHLDLPTQGAYGSQISWSSSNQDVITDAGTVTRPAAGQNNVTVTLTATISYGEGTSEAKRFAATVLAVPTDAMIAQGDLDAINLGSLNTVYTDLALPAKGNAGSTITWQSSRQNVLTNQGKVTRPASGSDAAQVTLKATADYNGAKVQKTFSVTVLPEYQIPDIEKIPHIEVATPVGVSPKLPDFIYVTYSDGSDDTVKVRWPDAIDADQYASAGTFQVTGTVIDTATEVTATVTVTETDETEAPDLEAIQCELSAVDLNGDTVLTQNRQRDINYLLRLDTDRMLYNFRKAFGQDTKNAEPLGGWDEPTGLLRGHSTGHFLSALALGYASTAASSDPTVQEEHKQLKEKMDTMVSELRKLQELSKGAPDQFKTQCTPSDASQSKWSTDPNTWGTGFLSAYSPDQFALLEQYTPYATIWAPYYTYHKVLAGMIDCYVYGGNETALEVAKGMGDWAYTRLSKCTTADQRNKMWSMYIAGEYGGMNEALAKLYLITDDQKYIDTAKMFDNKTFFDNLANNVDDIRLRHANQHIPQIIGALAEYKATGDKYYYNVASNFWDMVVSRYAFSIGGVGEGEKFTEPYTQAESIDGFTNCETCAAYNMLKLTKDLYSYDPDNGKYMDYYERTLLNQIAASQDPSQENSNDVTYMLPIGPGVSKEFSDDYDSFTCCHGTGMENHVKYQEAAYYHSADNSTLYVNLYMPTQFNWAEKGVVLKQETEFPSDHSEFTVQGNASFDLKLHVPYWAKDYSVTINGETAVSSATPSSYVSLDRNWKDGDKIVVNMPFGLHLDQTPDQLDGSMVASIMYGPIVMVGKSSSTDWINLTLSPDLADMIEVNDTSATKDTVTLETNGITLVPMYTAYDFPYHTYFKISTPSNEPIPNTETDLQSLYDSYRNITQGNYTDESWKSFTDALGAAESVLENGNATKNQIQAAAAGMINAVRKLSDTSPADKTALQTLYDSCKDLNQGDYTDESWRAFQTALSDAGRVLKDEASVQDDIESAKDQLSEAVDGLTRKTAKVLLSIGLPDTITGVANGTAKTKSALGLPSEITIVTDGGKIQAAVNWDVNGSSYDPSSSAEQTFTVTGTVTLPAEVENPNHILLNAAISVTVRARASGSDNSDHQSNDSPSSGGSSTVTANPGTVTTTVSPTGGTVATVTTQPASIPVLTGNHAAIHVTVPAVAASIVSAATAANPATVRIIAPTASIVEQLRNSMVGTVDLTVQASAVLVNNTNANAAVSIRVEPAVLQAAKDAQKDVTFSVIDAQTGTVAYSWTFSGADFNQFVIPVTTVNLEISVRSVQSDAAASAAAANNAADQKAAGLLLKFGGNGLLPAPATVRVYVGNQSGITPGSKIYLYCLNSTINALEQLSQSEYTVDTDGYITFTVMHCSDYVLLPYAATNPYPVKSDTTYPVCVKGGAAYTFAITSNSKTAPVFSIGNGKAFTSTLKKKDGKYYVTVKAIGTPGMMTALYSTLPGQKSAVLCYLVIK